MQASDQACEEWMMETALRACAREEDEYKTDWSLVVKTYGSKIIPCLHDIVLRDESLFLKRSALEYLSDLASEQSCYVAMSALVGGQNADIQVTALEVIAEIHCVELIAPMR